MSAANNNFDEYQATSLDAPYGAWFNTYDTNFQDPVTGKPAISRALWVSVAGAVKIDVIGQNGVDTYTVTYPNVPAGRFAIHAKKIYTTGTDDTTILVEI